VDKIQQDCDIKVNSFKAVLEEVRQTSVKNDEILKMKVSMLENEISLLQEGVLESPNYSADEFNEIRKVVINIAQVTQNEYNNFSKTSLDQLIEINENIVENNTALELNEKQIYIQELNHQIRDMENDNNDNIQKLTQEVNSLKQKLKDNETVIQSLQEDNTKLQQFIDSNLNSFFKVCKDNNMENLNQTKK